MKDIFSIVLSLVLTGAAISTVIFIAWTMLSKEPVSIGLYKDKEHTLDSRIYLALVVIGGAAIVGVGVYGLLTWLLSSLLTWLPSSADQIGGLAYGAALCSPLVLAHLERATFIRQELAVKNASLTWIDHQLRHSSRPSDREIERLEEESRDPNKTDTELRIASRTLDLAKKLKERDERMETQIIQHLQREQEEQEEQEEMMYEDDDVLCAPLWEQEEQQKQEEMMSTKIDVDRVPDVGMQRDGAQKSLFIKLWDAATGDSYRKSDWVKMDNILFSVRRTDAEKKILVELVTQQWALAKQRTPYDEDDWRALRRLIQQGVNPTNGDGVSQDYEEAVKPFRLAAEQGDAVDQVLLGLMYDTGTGVHRDRDEAVKWYRLAAEQGNAAAQYQLGAVHEHGKGVPQDYVEAARWYRLAAEQGDAYGQHSLAHMYECELGVHEDYIEAVKWFRLAAEQGHAKAQSRQESALPEKSEMLRRKSGSYFDKDGAEVSWVMNPDGSEWSWRMPTLKRRRG